MTAKEYLERMKTIKYQIKVKKHELKDLRDDIDTLKAPLLTEKVKGGKGSSFTNSIEKAIQLENDIKKETVEKISYFHDVHFKIKGLENELHNALLTDRYINNRRSDEISKDINYNAAYVRKLTSDALEAFIKKYGDNF